MTSARSILAADSEILRSAILRAGREDYLDLWFISRLARHELGDRPQEEINEIIFATIDDLLGAGLVAAGDLVPPGEFDPWQVTADKASERIRSRFTTLQRALQVGDVVWLKVSA